MARNAARIIRLPGVDEEARWSRELTHGAACEGKGRGEGEEAGPQAHECHRANARGPVGLPPLPSNDAPDNHREEQTPAIVTLLRR